MVQYYIQTKLFKIMSIQTIIENEINKPDYNHLDLHLILESFLLSDKENNNNLDTSFMKNPIVELLLNNSIFNSSKFTCLSSKDEKENSQTLTFRKIGDSFNDLLKITLKTAENNNHYYLEHIQGNTNTSRVLSLSDTLKHEIFVGCLKGDSIKRFKTNNFQINQTVDLNNPSKSIIEFENFEKIEKGYKEIFLSLIESIKSNNSVRDTFELLNIQYDFTEKEFEEKLVVFFEKENGIKRTLDLSKKINDKNFDNSLSKKKSLQMT